MTTEEVLVSVSHELSRDGRVLMLCSTDVLQNLWPIVGRGVLHTEFYEAEDGRCWRQPIKTKLVSPPERSSGSISSCLGIPVRAT